jgi:hypothetical protein
MFVIVELREGRKGKENDKSINNIIKHNHEGRGNEAMY